MTVRIARIEADKILDLSKKLDIYNEIPELLSVSLGAAETTLINLTVAYAHLLMVEKSCPNLISKDTR